MIVGFLDMMEFFLALLCSSVLSPNVFLGKSIFSIVSLKYFLLFNLLVKIALICSCFEILLFLHQSLFFIFVFRQGFFT